MRDLTKVSNPYGDDKVMAACGLIGAMDTSGNLMKGVGIIDGMANMHDRSNGLGGGFGVYGLYPDFPDAYAFHVMYNNKCALDEVRAYLKQQFDVLYEEEVPTRPAKGISNPPLVWRHFVKIGAHLPSNRSAEDYVVDVVMVINTQIADAFVFSSGINMGVFKGVGYPEHIADYFRLDEYVGYLWSAHGRFPTNTQGWWGGAHPFSILDWTVVHNGEISSYGINKRHLEMFGYQCALMTDTEVVAYAVDLLMRRHGLPIEMVAKVMAPPIWQEIERMPAKEQETYRVLRQVYGSLLMNGPFTIIIAHNGEMIGLTDRVRLRPSVAARKGDVIYFSSEESAIRLASPELDEVWVPMGGEPVVARLKTPAAGQDLKAEKEVVA
jgi:glutamate synthase domain-containing protein 1